MSRRDCKALALSLILTASLGLPWPGLAQDRYQSFDELKRRHKEGTDYAIHVMDRGGAATILAIHGGNIEPHTLELARHLAGSDLDLYAFEGKSPGLHLTSSHFDEPQAVAIARRGRRCISIHGFMDRKEGSDPDICVGGASKTLRQKTAAALRELGLKIEEPCRRLPGVHPKNVVNLCREGGVQLEMSPGIRSRLVSEPLLRARWIEGLRKAVLR